MGATIVSTSIVDQNNYSSLDFSGKAGTDCVEKAGLALNDVDILINIGVYHDDNIMEPAMAPLIQKKLGMNLDPVKKGTGSTFCFDLYNGACGFINALQVADSFLNTGRARYVLIVSGDTHPSKEKNETFPFTPIGAAALLALDENPRKGFTGFYVKTNTNGRQGLIGGGDVIKVKNKGRGFMGFTKDDDYEEAISQLMVSTTVEFTRNRRIDLNAVNFLISSQQKPGFAGGLHKAVGMNGASRYVDLYERYGDAHTSSLPLGFHHLREEGAIKENDSILFAAAGSGLTAACAMYRA